MIAGLAVPAAAWADGSDPIIGATVYSGGSAPTYATVSASDLVNTSGCTPYSGPTLTQLDDHGDISGAGPSGGSEAWSLATALSCTPQPVLASPGAVQTITVVQSNGIPETGPDSTLTPDDFQPTSFAGGQLPIVIDGAISTPTGQYEYARPQRSASDVNAPDQVQVNAGTPIQLLIGTAAPIAGLSITPSATQISPGATVTFTPSVIGAQYGYQWTFADGTPATSTSPDPQVTFSDPGNWNATLVVTDGGSVGTASRQITVGTPTVTATTTTGAFTTTTSTTATTTTAVEHPGRPGHTKTTTAGRSTTTSPTTAATTPATTTTANTPTATATAITTTTTTTSAATGSSTSTTTTANTPTAASQTTPAPIGPTVSQTPAATPTPTATATSRATTTTAPTQTTPPRTPTLPGTKVSGRLVADVVPLSALSSPLVHAISGTSAASPEPVAGRAPGTSPWAIVGAALAVLALLGLGAGRELRGRINWRSLRPPPSR